MTCVILSVTVLGSNDGDAPGAVGRRIVDYLEGGRAVIAGRRPGHIVELPAPEGGVVAYYADSAGLRAPRWLGERSGAVDGVELGQLLSGVDPLSGEPLITAQGSAGRAEQVRRSGLQPADLAASAYSASEAATLLGVTPSYLRRVCREQQALGDGAVEGIDQSAAGEWTLDRAAVLRLCELRRPARVVTSYDLTFSVPKSVSVLWAAADEQTRTAVLDALDESVAAGLRYLERHAFKVRVKGNSELATGVVAADYLHVTSRALEPQLHHHVVLVNAGRSTDGERRALDGRFLFQHAKAASHLAGAELRHQLTARLGVSWRPVAGRPAEIEGIAREALAAMSSRRAEIVSAVAARGLTSAAARQVAAWETRAAKEHPVSIEALFAVWNERLDAAGYGEGARRAVTGKVAAPQLLTEAERRLLIGQLLRVGGLTEHRAVFDRRRVVEAIADAAVDRLSGDAIDALADEVLASPDLVALDSQRAPRAGIRRRDGKVVKLPGQRLYSTAAMLALEWRALTSYEVGRAAGVGVVPAGELAAVLDGARFERLSEEQRRFVSSLTTSGFRIQVAVGAAGSGKTTALAAAVAAWHASGWKVLGAAVGGTQALVLAEETGVEARTVASLLAVKDASSLFSDRTVILVDEASLLSTKEFAQLAQIAEQSGAALRLVGDPAQHSSVEAGGILRHLVEAHPEDVASLTHLYRQQGEEMAEVRLANAEYRERAFSEALERLRRDGRITEAETADEAYDLLTSAWYLERQRRVAEPARRRSAMTADHHRERVDLNDHARMLLAADGTLSGPEVRFGGLSFRVGDEVIARLPDRGLRAEGAGRGDFVRNGSLGVVRSVGEEKLLIEFERFGLVDVPRQYLEAELSSGIVGGLQHAYCLTSHAAQGETFAAAAPLVTDTSAPEGVYVGITRGQFDLQAVVVRRRDLVPTTEHSGLPILEDETGALQATERHLEAAVPELLASDLLSVRAAPNSQSGVAGSWSDERLQQEAERWRTRIVATRSEMERLEGDLARRQSIAAVSPEQQRELARLNAATSSQLTGLSRRVEHLLDGDEMIREELASRGLEMTLRQPPVIRPAAAEEQVIPDGERPPAMAAAPPSLRL